MFNIEWLRAFPAQPVEAGKRCKVKPLVAIRGKVVNVSGIVSNQGIQTYLACAALLHITSSNVYIYQVGATGP